MQSKSSLPSIGILLTGGLGTLAGLFLAALLFIVSIFGMTENADVNQTFSILVMAWVAAFIGLLNLPAAIIGIQRLLGKPQLSWQPEKFFRVANQLIPVWLLCVGLIALGISSAATNLWVTPLVVPAVAIPMLWFLTFGIRKLTTGSPQRSWGSLSFNFVVTMPLVLGIEMLVFAGLFLAALLWVSSQPEMVNWLMNFVQPILQNNFDLGELQMNFDSILNQPGVIPILVLVIAVLMPLIEELFKPMVIWLFAGKNLSPAQGFVMGALAGASFGLVESLGALASSTGSDLIGLVFGRLGTGLVHITTSALVGYGIVLAFHDQKRGRLLGYYLAAVALHGGWNLVSLITGIAPLLPATVGNFDFAQSLGNLGPLLMGILGIIDLVVLASLNRKVHAREQPAFEGTLL